MVVKKTLTKNVVYQAWQSLSGLFLSSTIFKSVEKSLIYYNVIFYFAKIFQLSVENIQVFANLFLKNILDEYRAVCPLWRRFQ